MEIVTGICLTVVITALITIIESCTPVERFPIKSRLRGLLFAVLNVAIGLPLLWGLQSLWRAFSVRPILAVPAFWEPGAILFGLLLADFIGYWNHRVQHRFLWSIHAVHHSQTELHAANNYAHFLERPLGYIVFGIPLSLIDFRFATTPVFFVILREALQYYIHSPTTIHFGSVSKVLVDNRFHRIHHSLEFRHFDRNFGIMFPFWDRLFGTVYEPESDQWPNVGLHGHPPPTSIIEYMLYPLRFASSRRENNPRTEVP